MFEDTLEEEKEADRKLTEIAESLVNEEPPKRRGDEDAEDFPRRDPCAVAHQVRQAGRRGGSRHAEELALASR